MSDSQVYGCPFCRSTSGEIFDGHGPHLLFYECDGCGATGPYGDSRDAAINRWNHRPPDPSLQIEDDDDDW